jgi:hypothetical protein
MAFEAIMAEVDSTEETVLITRSARTSQYLAAVPQLLLLREGWGSMMILQAEFS